jgi:hypothetical protein
VKRLQAQHRLVLSGTPIQNSALELWSLFDFLMPGFLGGEAAAASACTQHACSSCCCCNYANSFLQAVLARAGLLACQQAQCALLHPCAW